MIEKILLAFGRMAMNAFGAGHCGCNPAREWPNESAISCYLKWAGISKPIE